MLQIAIEMLLGDRVKYTILICALAFSTLLMTQQMSVFLGVIKRSISILQNTNAKIWVVDPYVEHIEFPFAFKDTYLDIVRSLPGVKAAWPILYKSATIKTKNISLIGEFLGVDPQTLTGLPPKVVKGSLKSLWNDNTIALDVLGAQLLSKGMSKPLDVGDIVNVNDHEVKVVAILNAYPAFSTAPHGYLTYTEANQILPESRHNLSYIIVEPKEGYTNEMVIHEIETKTPLKAYTSSEFAWKTIWWITQNTGIVLSFATTIILGFIVGIVVAGQTFYSFIYENSGNLAALKAMGISDALMQKMIFMQVFIAGFIGYGIGLFFTSVFGVFTFIYPILPFYINYTTLFLTFLLVVSICFFSAYLGIKKITSVSPAEVFRG